MSAVSAVGETLLAKLVAWELLGDRDADPHRLLRDLSNRDLELIKKNLEAGPKRVKETLCYELVEVESLYRHGMLEKDWSLKLDGNRARLCFSLVHNTSWKPAQNRMRA